MHGQAQDFGYDCLLSRVAALQCAVLFTRFARSRGLLLEVIYEPNSRGLL